MTRSQPALSPSLRAVLAAFVTLLQLLGALHFTLVKHSYSAALGGVVHVHGLARAEAKPHPGLRGERRPALTSGVPTCGTELCPLADAAQSSAPRFESLAAGKIAFGDAQLLSERKARSTRSLRLFLSAPKTSPPV